MHSTETFHLPGLEAAQEVLDSLEAPPRQIVMVGGGFDILWRVGLFSVLCFGLALLAHPLLNHFVTSASLSSWALSLGLVPIVLGFVPYALIRSYRRRRRSGERFERLYRDGSACIGHINILSIVNGNEHDNYYLPRDRAIFQSIRVRIDYTYLVDAKVLTGSIYLKEESARFIGINDEICVIYDPEKPTVSTLFPVPSKEIQSVFF